MNDNNMPLNQWLAIRKAGLKIDPATAEVMWTYGYTLDPYGVYELSDEEKQIGREYFARVRRVAMFGSASMTFPTRPRPLCGKSTVQSCHFPLDSRSSEVSNDHARLATAQLVRAEGAQASPPGEKERVVPDTPLWRRPGLAEFERSLISIRTADGRELARKSGVKFGPKFKLTRHQIEEIKSRKELGESCRFLARSYGVSPNTISRVK